MPTFHATINLQLQAGTQAEADGIADGAAEHLRDTFNDDGSLLQAAPSTAAPGITLAFELADQQCADTSQPSASWTARRRHMPERADAFKTAVWQAHIRTRPQWRSAHYLRLLHAVYWPRIEQRRDARLLRLSLGQRIASCAEGGKILVLESGRDCDGCQYTGRKHTIDATLAAYDALDARLGDWADGPYFLRVVPPSYAPHVIVSSRDLGLEAFESGHPHVIVSRFA